MLDPTSLIILHTLMMWSLAAAFWLVVLVERGWSFPWQWACGFAVMPLVMVIGGWGEQIDDDRLRVAGFLIGFLGPALLFDGMRVFFKQRLILLPWIALFTLFTGAILATTVIAPSLVGRLMVFEILMVVLSGYGFWLLRFMKRADHPLGFPLAIVGGCLPMASALGNLVLQIRGATPALPPDAALVIIAATVIAMFGAITLVILIAERLNARLGQEMRTDVLTGLATRRAYDDGLVLELKRAQRQGRPLSVILVDADYFKAINDTHGHHVGDAALRQIAACIRDTVRPTDLSARLGGDEFAVLLPDTDSTAASAIAQRILGSMRASSFEVITGRIELSASIGVATALSAITPAALMKAADEALYLVKRRGRTGVESVVIAPAAATALPHTAAAPSQSRG